MAYKLNDKTFRVDRAFTLNQIQYPRNWLQLSTKEDRDALGITWEDDPVRADDRYYWNGEIDNPKAMEDVDAKDQDGNQIYVQVWNPETEAMEDTEEKLVTNSAFNLATSLVTSSSVGLVLSLSNHCMPS